MHRFASNFVIFLLAAFFTGLNIFLSSVNQVLLSLGSYSPLTSGIGILGDLSPLTITSYLFHPALFFVAIYLFVGKRIDLRVNYKAVALSLFLGGASGNLIGTLFGVYYSATTPTFPPGLEPVLAGLFAFFTGFSATALAYVRTGTSLE